jgi:hypothetical protein
VLALTKDAIFSDDGSKRFVLIRDWHDEIGAPQLTVNFVMLNPSIAGKYADDPTVRKCIGFARRWGFGRLVVTNLIATVSTDPWELPHWAGFDLENQRFVREWAEESNLVVAAWGTQPSAICRKVALAEHLFWFRENIGRKIHSIGTTKGGEPLHPSRAPYTENPAVWRERVEDAA